MESAGVPDLVAGEAVESAGPRGLDAVIDAAPAGPRFASVAALNAWLQARAGSTPTGQPVDLEAARQAARDDRAAQFGIIRP